MLAYDETLSRLNPTGATVKPLWRYLRWDFLFHTTKPVETKLIIYCPTYDHRFDNNGHKPMTTSGGVGWMPATADWAIRSYRENDWLQPIPGTDSWIKSNVDKNLPRLSSLWDSQLLLVAEGYSKNGFTDWGELYHNPHHRDRCTTVQADAGVLLRPIDAANKSPGVLWQPKSAGKDSTLTWGRYLHPDYLGW